MRSIDQLRPWSGNPRLNPEGQHVSLRDYIDDIIQEDGDKANFMALVRSIATNGFIPADPIVVWQDARNGRYYVAEGNRRILALKLLRDPDRAPREIRGTLRHLSAHWERVDKVPVSIAPSFEAAEWYISQRNSTSTIQKPWTRLQQMRWLESLYEKYSDNEELLTQKANMTMGAIEPMIRLIKLLNLVREDEVRSALTEQEFADATSHRFPMTILERFFGLAKVQERWGITFDGPGFSFCNRAGFLVAYTQLIKAIVNPTDALGLNTRNISADTIDDLLDKLPKVDISVSDPYTAGAAGEEEPGADTSDGGGGQPAPQPKPKPRDLKGDLNRNHLIIGCYQLNTAEARLKQLFGELKRLSVNSYVSVCAAAVRVFLDLTILDFIQSEGLVEEFQRRDGKELKRILLKTRIDFLLKYSRLKDDKKAAKILRDLINDRETYCLDILNGYVHSKQTEYLNKQYLNGFWDHIFPLLQAMLDIQEIDE